MSIASVQATIKGTAYSLSLNSSTGLYEASVTAPSTSSYNNNSDHYFPITVKATTDAGNSTTVSDTDSTLGKSLRLQVLETTAPVITIGSPTEDEVTSNTTPVIVFTVTDDDSGVNADSISISVDDETVTESSIVKTAITNGYTCSYNISNVLDEGIHTVIVNAQDNDGNSSTPRTVNFKVDVTPPSLSVESPVNNFVTNQDTCVVSGAASDVTGGIEKVTLRINGGSAIEAEVDDDGKFSKSITLTEGANTIVITAYDKGGLSSSITRIATLDTKAPVIEDITITPNPVSTGEVFKISVQVTD